MTHADFISPEIGLSFMKWKKKTGTKKILKPIYLIGVGVLNILDVIYYVVDYFAKNV